MKKGPWIFVGVLNLICIAAVVVVAHVMGGCDHMLETTTAGQVPMKCHWSFVAVGYTGIIGIVSTLFGITGKRTGARRVAACITIVTCVIVALFPTDLVIGICANSEMHCHTTAYVVWALAAVSAILSIVQIIGANSEKADRPKMTL